jgi:hypothetical protein
MTGKSFLGAVLLTIGLIVGVVALTGFGLRETPQDAAPIVGDQNQPARSEAASMALPLLAGLAIAGGAALIGIGMGAFANPKIVPPDSPRAHKAATTTDKNL